MGTIQKGLEGVEVTDSGVGLIIGKTDADHPDLSEGLLYYRGIDIRALATQSTFEEVTFLLWNDRLPTRGELEEFTHALATSRTLPEAVHATLAGMPRADVSMMDVLRTAVSQLGLRDADRNCAFDDRAANARKATRLTAQVPTIIAAYSRRRAGLEPIAPDESLGTAENFLFMLSGERPSEAATRMMDLALVLHAEHGFNASTFASRVTTATESDLHSAICSAVGTLKGPLHGGANAKALANFEAIGSVANVEPWLDAKLAAHEKIMGLGHRVYKVRDPRASLLQAQADKLVHEAGDTTLYDIATKLEQTFLERMGAKGKGELQANVDFYSGVVYKMLGIATELFTPIFAISRMAGWCAHVLEQQSDNRLIRPRCRYVGKIDAPYIPLADRD